MPKSAKQFVLIVAASVTAGVVLDWMKTRKTQKQG